MSLPIIAIIGRPNTGKSTLFNRLVGQRAAITSPKAGTTRDRVYHETNIGTYRCILVDTGGLDFDASIVKTKSIESDVQAQARIAIEEANIIYFVMDATEPLTANDIDCAQLLRKTKKPILLVANKTDNQKSEENLADIMGLGFGEPLCVSSIHNIGISELEDETDRILKKMKWKKEKPHAKKITHVAIVGKPNVGKTSIVNGLLGQERLIVSDIPGTTVDSTDSPLTYNENDFVLIDTAGIRRRGKREKGIEKYSVLRSLRAISGSDVACLVIDYGEGITNQDLHVCEYALDANKGIIIVINKVDLMEDPSADRKKFFGELHYRMPFIPWAPVIFTSAIKKKNLGDILDLSKNIAVERTKRVSDDDFKLFLKTTILSHPPTHSGQKIIIKKGMQTDICPPTFEIYANKPDIIHFSYKRFLENEIRRKFGFHGTAIILKLIEMYR